MSHFDELGLSGDVLRAADAEGYQIATPIQIEAIPGILAGRDLVGIAQTGTGKTAAFAMPTLDRLSARGRPPERSSDRDGARGRGRRHGSGPSRAIRALVLAPTRELAAQIGASFSAYGRFTGLANTVIYGGVGQNPQVRAIRQGVDILVATPGRLEDLMGQGIVNLRSVEVLILDEADHMLDIGFIHALKRIVKTVPVSRQTLMFSATMSPDIRRLSKEWLRDPVHVAVAPVSSPAEDVEQSIFHVEKRQKPHLLEVLLRDLPGSRSLAFTRTKHGADKVVKHLKRAGILAAAIHGNKSQGQRERALEQFKSGQIAVLVATDIAARGLDIDAITHVFNFDLPEVAEVYVHRIGRTGRAGATGIAISFCASDQEVYLRAIERLTKRMIRVEPMPRELPSGLDRPAPREPTRVTRTPRARERFEITVESGSRSRGSAGPGRSERGGRETTRRGESAGRGHARSSGGTRPRGETAETRRHGDAAGAPRGGGDGGAAKGDAAMAKKARRRRRRPSKARSNEGRSGQR